ncbi:DUF6223 family protein [Nocardia salmonicida]|uniref:DUF6223 family protein n=1 Tax=Nocardia salmonicida TaxID=53431 RepID=UPI00379BE59C
MTEPGLTPTMEPVPIRTGAIERPATHDEEHPMSVRPLTAVAVTAATTLADSHGMTTDRLVATSAAFLGLAAVILGGWAMAHTGNPARSFVAIGAGAVAAMVGVIGFVTADGGPGTGNGIVGAAIAIVLGLSAIALGTRARTRR